jgi:secretion/DNA translocation related CpaE-like protein
MSVESPHRPLVITTDPDLREELERLCAAAGLAPDVVARPGDGRGRWTHAACVVVGDDAADAVEAADLRSRPGIVLVTRHVSMRSWQRAVAIRAESVVELPTGRTQLASLLADAGEVVGESGRVVGVVGTRGGIGASTVAARLGLVAAGLGHAVVLVDADPSSGGLDMLLGCEATPGLRWPDIAAVNGRVSSAALRAALPNSRGLAVLSWLPGAPTEVPAGTVAAIVSAAKRGSELVVVDLARHLDVETQSVLSLIDAVVLVSGCDVRSVAAATRMVEQLRPQCPDLRLVVRESRSDGFESQQVGVALNLAVEATTRHTRRTERAINDGLGPLVGRRDRRDLGRLVAGLLASGAL